MEDVWPTPWLKGFLETAVLAVIAKGETYGYELGRSLSEAGFGEVKGGTLYPILGRLEAAGLVETTWRQGEFGPGRKYYAITRAGRTDLDARAATWQAFSANLTALTGDHHE